MTIDPLDPHDRENLQQAAGLLTGVGYADPLVVDSGVALVCLAAAEQLRAMLGSAAPRLHLDARRAAGAIEDALARLASLPDEVFATEAVLEAATYARDARALLS